MHTLTHGILPYQHIAKLVDQGSILAPQGLLADQIQPASLDLTLGAKAYRVRASFLPRSRSVRDRLDDVLMHEIDLLGGAVMEAGCVYIAEIQEIISPADHDFGACQSKIFNRARGCFCQAFDRWG